MKFTKKLGGWLQVAGVATVTAVIWASQDPTMKAVLPPKVAMGVGLAAVILQAVSGTKAFDYKPDGTKIEKKESEQ